MYQLSDIRVDYAPFQLNIRHLEVLKGEMIAMVGPNGSGKSTLLNLLSFIRKADSGELLFRSKKIDFKNRIQLLANRREVSYLQQNSYLFSMNVYDNISCGLKLRKVDNETIRQKTGTIMEQLSLTHLAMRRIHTLSGGEAQRVAIARTMVIDAEVYLFDEPTSNVDRDFIRTVEELITAVNREKGATIILTTHSREQAYRLSDRLYSIINGKLKNLPYENIFSGELSGGDEGLKTLKLSETISLNLACAESGPVTVAIDPMDIILSSNKIESSARNSFKGTIKRVDSYNDSLQVFVDVGVPICALITARSFHDLKLNIGSGVWVTFKANSVRVI